MRFENDFFKISYDEVSMTLSFEGSMRLNDLGRFDKIKQFMLEVYNLDTDRLVIDFMNLDFLNSAGISTLCNFIFEVKTLNKKSVSIIGNASTQWQKKSLANLKIIWDKLEIVFR